MPPNSIMLSKNYFLQVAVKKTYFVALLFKEKLFLMDSEHYKLDGQIINWESVLLELTAYAHTLIKAKSWFRKKSDSFLQGKNVDDYVMEAISKYLNNPEKYNPSKGTFINYLKYNILRHLVHNDAKSPENKTTNDVFGKQFKEEDDPGKYYDAILPCIEEYFDDQIDYNTVVGAVEKKCENDEIAYKIFYEVFLCGGKRREVCKEQDISETDYDNGIRRLLTILKETATQYQIKRQSS
jgi:hypothetical protein